MSDIDARSRASAQQIVSLYDQYGSADYIGEHVTQMQHALQCADLASADLTLFDVSPFVRNCLIAAALLHDIGHLIGLQRYESPAVSGLESQGLGISGHENIGAKYLQTCGMPSLVCELVASHVPTKRYLCYADPNYSDNLSDASRKTLYLQGGPLSKQEAQEFLSDPLCQLKIRLRGYDDLAKDTTKMLLPSIDRFIPLLTSLLSSSL